VPRKPSDSVVEHRICFGKWERELIKNEIIPVYIAKEIGETSATILQAIATASATTIGAYVALWTAWKVHGFKDESINWLKELAKEGKDPNLKLSDRWWWPFTSE